MPLSAHASFSPQWVDWPRTMQHHSFTPSMDSIPSSCTEDSAPLLLHHHFFPFSTGSLPKSIQIVSDSSCIKRKRKKEASFTTTTAPFITPTFATNSLCSRLYSQRPTINQLVILLALRYKSISPCLKRITATTWMVSKNLPVLFRGCSTKQRTWSF